PGTVISVAVSMEPEPCSVQITGTEWRRSGSCHRVLAETRTRTMVDSQRNSPRSARGARARQSCAAYNDRRGAVQNALLVVLLLVISVNMWTACVDSDSS